MIIVLIHWRIKPDEATVSHFLHWWKTEAKIKNKSNLVGEFLSVPLPAGNFPFLADDLTQGLGENRYRHFINVGLWKDLESFYTEVGHNFRDNDQPMEFEAEKRKRTILGLEEWRIGAWDLPAKGTCL